MTQPDDPGFWEQAYEDGVAAGDICEMRPVDAEAARVIGAVWWAWFGDDSTPDHSDDARK